MPRQKTQKMMMARTTGMITVNGVSYQVQAGVTRVSEDNELYEANPSMWVPVTSSYPNLERMTAAPGEKRGD